MSVANLAIGKRKLCAMTEKMQARCVPSRQARFNQWFLKSLTCLKKCGMSIQEMKDYLALCLEGEPTIPQRQKVLAEKRAALLAEIKELQDCVDYVDWKQSFYNEVLTGQRPYESNLIRAKE